MAAATSRQGDVGDSLYRRCLLCDNQVHIERFNRGQGCCDDCHAERRRPRRTPYTESRKAYLQRLSVPELNAYVQGQLHAREHGPGVVEELRLIADRLEWVADSLIVAGVDGWNATYGGLLSITPPRPIGKR